MTWHQSLPPAQALVPCGAGTHPVRWAAGRLTIPEHPDMEAENVLAALGGDKPLCVEVAQAWDTHADDLDVLMAGPRSRADTITSGWGDVKGHESIILGRTGGVMKAAMPQELARLIRARAEILRLLALGPALQFRLAGTVAAAWSARPGRDGERRPELVAALSGRLAPAVAEWLGIDPDSVLADPLAGASPPQWGTLQAFGSGAALRVRASLPFGWLASVWACGLAVVDGHLVVAVEQPGWPRVRVRALREPGTDPVWLDLVAADDMPLPHWAIAD